MIDRQTIFITGAASGLGRETARLFASKGWFVGATDINGPGLETLRAELGPDNCFIAVHDVTDRADWTQAVEGFSAATGGRMDLFFNNAGIGLGGPLDEMPEGDAAKVIAVNFQGVVHGIYACLPLLKATAAETGRATIVNMGSASGMIGSPGMAMYTATKHAVRGMTDSLSAEFKRFGIRVAELQPAFIDTAILDSPLMGSNHSVREQLAASKVPVAQPSLISEAVWRIAHTDNPKVHYALGWPARMLQIYARFFPKTLRWLMGKGFTRNAEKGDGK